MKNFHTRCSALLFLLGITMPLQGQDSCFEIRFSTESAQPGDTIEVKVTVRGFVDLNSLQFASSWDTAQLKYVRYSANNAPISGQFFSTTSTSQGVFRMGWAHPLATGATLPDDAVLFRMYFKVRADSAGFCAVIIKPNDFTVYEAVDVYNKKFSLSHTAGGALVNKPLSLAMAELCVKPPTCIGNAGFIQANVTGGVPPYQFQWTGPNGFSATDSIIYPVTTGQYNLVVTDTQGDMLQALTSYVVNGTVVTLSVSATSDATCDLANGCANAYASGGTPPYTFEWSQPGGASPNRCDLPGGEHRVTVTDTKGCKVEKTFYVKKDTILSVTPSAEYADCRFGTLGKITLTTDGTAPLNYLWSNGETVAVMEDVRPGLYAVTVSDGIGCTGAATVTMKDYGIFDWDFKLETNASDNKNPINLRGYALAQRVKPPLQIKWDNGTRQEIPDFDASLVWQYVSRFPTVPSGNYSVTLTDADGCSLEKETLATHENAVDLPDPFFYSSPALYLRPYNTNGEVELCVRNFKGVKKLQFTILWNYPGLTLETIASFASFVGGLTLNCFDIGPNQSNLDFRWESSSPNGFAYYSDIALFRMKFKVISANGVGVGFGKDPLIEMADGTKAPFVGRSGNVYFNPPNNGIPAIPEFDLSLPLCQYDGYRRVLLERSSPSKDPYLEISNDQFSLSNGKRASSDLLFAKPGQMEFRTDAGGFLVSIPPYDLPSAECVWPGDADNNGMVNHFDLLYLGFGVGSIEVARNGIDTLWQGAGAPDWSESSPFHQVNFKNLDLDGDGIITPEDTATLYHHWGRSINPYDKRNPYAQPAPDTANLAWKINIQADTLASGKEIRIPFALSAEDIHGLAFSISYDSVLVVSDARFELATDSWLGDPAINLLQIQRDFQSQSRLDVAISRSDRKAASGDGIIGYLVLKFSELPANSWLRSTLFVAHTLAVTPSDKRIALGETRQPIVLRGLPDPISGVSETLDNKLLLSPNPATDALTIKSIGAPMRRVEIWSAEGKIQQTFDRENATQKINTEVKSLPPGTYFARVFFEGDAVALRRFVVMR